MAATVRQWARQGGFLVAAVALLAACAAAPMRDAAELPRWREGAALPLAHGEVAMSATPRVLEGTRVEHVAVVGGISGLGRTQDTVFFYDPDRDAWREGPSLPGPRHHTAAASLDRALYVSGGAPATRGTWEPQADLWRLDADAERWQALEPMPEGRLGHRLVAHEGRLYAVGGVGPGSEVFIYDPDGGWTRGAELPDMRDHLSVVVAGSEIWAIGGRIDGNSVSRVDIYDPVADRWSDGPDLPEVTSGAAEGFIDGSIHVYGGEEPGLIGGAVFDRHWRIDPGAPDPDWEPASPPIQAVHGAEGAVLEGRFYIAGGASRQGMLSAFSWSDLLQIREP